VAKIPGVIAKLTEA